MKREQLSQISHLIILIILFFLLTTNVYANNIKLNLNRKKIDIPKKMGTPFILDGQAYIPARFIAKHLGFTINWDEIRKEAYFKKGDMIVTLPTNGTNPTINGRDHLMDGSPIMKNNRVYVPIWFIATITGKHVNYSENNKTISISDGEIGEFYNYIEGNHNNYSDIPITEKMNTNSSEKTSPKFRYSRQSVKAGNKYVNANIVTVNPNNGDLKVEMVLANDRLNSVENFQSMINRKRPKVAVNGYYFAAYDSSKTTYGHIINNYKTYTKEGFSTGFFIDSEGKPHVGKLEDHNLSREEVQHYLTVNPFLVKNSENLGRAGGNMSAGRGYSRAQRTAIGVTKNGFIMLVTANGITATELADLMINIGCIEAGNLDGGATSGLYYKGKMITRPGRAINHAIFFY